MTDINELQKIVGEIQSEPEIQFQQLDASFFSNRPSKYLEVTSSSRQEGLICTIGKAGFEYRLKHPAYMTDISFYSDKPARRPSLRVEVLPVSGDPPAMTKTYAKENEPNGIFAEVNMVVRGFKVSADGWLVLNKNEKISSIIARGYSLTDIENLEAKIQKHFDLTSRLQAEIFQQSQELRDKIEKFSEERLSHSQEVAQAKQEIADKRTATEEQIAANKKAAADALRIVKAEHTELLAQKNAELGQKKEEILSLESQCLQLTTDVEHLDQEKLAFLEKVEEQKSKLDSLAKTERDIDQRISEKIGELNRKTEQASILNEKLHALNNDISLFTDDMKGFAEQGDKQVKTYLYFIIIPMIVVAASLAGYAIFSASTLFGTYIDKPELNVWHLLLLKAPFTAMLGSLLTFFYKAGKPFVAAIREIHDKRLRLSEISILARDASDSTLASEKMAEEDRVKIRLEARMRLIRDFLTGKFQQPSENIDSARPLQLSSTTQPLNELLRAGAEARPSALLEP